MTGHHFGGMMGHPTLKEIFIMSHLELLGALKTVIETTVEKAVENSFAKAVAPLREDIALVAQKIDRVQDELKSEIRRVEGKTDLTFKAVMEVSRNVRDLKQATERRFDAVEDRIEALETRPS